MDDDVWPPSKLPPPILNSSQGASSNSSESTVAMAKRLPNLVRNKRTWPTMPLKPPRVFYGCFSSKGSDGKSLVWLCLIIRQEKKGSLLRWFWLGASKNIMPGCYWGYSSFLLLFIDWGSSWSCLIMNFWREQRHWPWDIDKQNRSLDQWVRTFRVSRIC